MNEYNPFGEEGSPFDEDKDLLLELEPHPKKDNTSNKSTIYSVMGTISIFFIIFLNTFVFNSPKGEMISAIGESPHIPEDNTTDQLLKPSISSTTSSTTTTTFPEQTSAIENNTVVSKDSNLSLINELDQNLIIEKTVQVVAEGCGLGPDDRESSTNVGSGVLISSDGYLISNSHIIEECYGLIYIAITKDPDTPTEITYIAEVVEQSQELDLILLKVISTINNEKIFTSFKYFELFETEQLILGETINIWGYPTARGDGFNYHLKINLTKGTVSGFESDYAKKRGWIVTDADITYGNSGGAGLDSHGRLIGIPTHGISEGTSWLGYLRSVDVIKAWLRDVGQENLILYNSTP